MYKLRTNYGFMRRRIVELSKQYFESNKIRALVLGVSGGIDSALVAALMCDTGVSMYGYILPLNGNKDEEMSRAEEIGRVFCDNLEIVDLTDVVDAAANFCSLFPPYIQSINELIRLGNLKARTRMMYLFDRAKAYNGLVLSTDNLTEYMLGFWTLHGDVGNFGPIQQLWKTEVYGLAEFLVAEYRKESKHRLAAALQACIDAVPTDGLGITNSDFDQIMPGQDEQKSPKERYKEVDEVLIQYLQTNEVTNNPVIQRHIASEFKRRDPVNINRDLLVEEL